MKRTLLGVLVVLGLAISCSSTSTTADGAGAASTPGTPPGSTPSGADGAPNVLFVLTDDMRLDDLQHLPHIRQVIGEEGMTFDAHFDNVTLCCPARTSILRGQYSHNTGVLTNGGTNGGFETAHADKVEDDTVATAMHAAGYTTGFFGKYLNGYPNTVSPSYVPPGWDTWSSSTKGNAYGEYDYTLNENGTQVAYGHDPSDYGTDVYARQTTAFIDQATDAGRPFFAYLSVYAPHQPATPAPQDEKAFPGLKAPRDAAYDEADVSDKPQFIQDLPSLTPADQRRIDAIARKRAQSLQAVDRDVAGLVDHLREIGQLDNTVIIFTSDNGFHLGQHRMPAGKQTAYETDIHLPLLVRGPGIAAGTHVGALTGNIDLAPTIAALGGATMTVAPDGRSLVPLLHGDGPPDGAGRQAFLLEHWTSASTPQDRSGAGQLEPDDIDQGGGDGGGATTSTSLRLGKASLSAIPEFQGLRTAGYTYVEYATGEKELYDLTQDPDQLVNRAGTADPAMLAALHQRLDALRSCRAEDCRSAEDQPLSLGR
jgi:N-acetylglucosamine-6-sulfatase